MSTAYEQTLYSIASQVGSRREFLERVIDHAIQEFDAVGGMFWDCSATEPKPICQHYRGDEVLKLGCSAQQHSNFLRQACESSEPLLVSGTKDGQLPADGDVFPTILLVATKHGGRTEVAELFFDGEISRGKVAANVAALAKLCQGASVHGMPTKPAAQVDTNVKDTIRLSDTEAYIHSLHQSLDLKDCARTIANETRRFLDCDRVSVVVFQGKRCRTLAISGQPSVNRRSNAVRMLEKVINKVLPVRQLFWHPDKSSLPPQIDGPLQSYLADSTTRTLIVVPVFDRVEGTEMQVDASQEKARLIGGIVVEHCREQWDRESRTDVLELATRHGSDAFRSAWHHQSLLLYGLWKWLGKSKVAFAARHLPKTIAAVLALMVAGLVLNFWQTDFELTCEGVLIPERRELVFPQNSGVISEVMVEHGQQVNAGDPLVKMSDLDLEYQLAEIKGQISELEEAIRSIRSSRLNRRSDDESFKKESLKSLQAQLESLNEQQRIFKRREQSLVVTSPLSGQVMTWEVRERLQNRPVGVESQLMEVADVDGEWVLELDLPDRKVGHFLNRWEDVKANGKPVEVEFVLAAEPGVTHFGVVSSVATSTQINAANEHHLKIQVAIDIEQMSILQSRSGVVAKIDCGTASIGYVWFHPVKEFFQSKVLFPFW